MKNLAIDLLKEIVGQQLLLFYSKKTIYSGMLDCLCFDPKYDLILNFINLDKNQYRRNLIVKYRIPKDGERGDVLYFNLSLQEAFLEEIDKNNDFKYYMPTTFIVDTIRVYVKKICSIDFSERVEIRSILLASKKSQYIMLEPDSICESFEPVKIILDKDRIDLIISSEYSVYDDDNIKFDYEVIEFK